MTATDTAPLAHRLPDLPRWVEARGLLLLGECELFGLGDGGELAVVVRDPGTGSVFVVGRPAAAALHEAVERNLLYRGEVIAPPEQAAWVAEALPGWTRTRCILHALRDPERLPRARVGQEVGFLHPDALGRLDVPAELRRELESGAEHSPIAASFAGARPVSFCYAGAATESLWDVAIDTLPEHRRAGHAARCAAYMIRHMQALGKQPVWDSAEDNPPSWRLARKLGFEPVDELALFAPER